MPTRREGESRRKYDARIAASLRFNLEPENITQTDQSRLHKHDQPQVGAESFLLEDVRHQERARKRVAIENFTDKNIIESGSPLKMY
jgi:hypothetical protein